MPLGIEMLVERIFFGTGRIVGDDRERAAVRDRLAEMVCIIGGIGHDDVCGQVFDQGCRLGRVACLARCQDEPDGASQPPNGQMDLCAQPTARASNGLIFRPPFFAPLAC